MSDQRAHHRHPVHNLLDARQEIDREVNARVDLSDHEILGHRRIVFEVEGVEMADGSRDYVEDDIARAAPRLDFAAGVGGARFRRPCDPDGSAG